MNQQIKPLNNTATNILSAIVALNQVVGHSEILMANEIAVLLGDNVAEDAVKVQVIGDELVISFASEEGLGHLEETAKECGFSLKTIGNVTYFARPVLGPLGEAMVTARRRQLDDAEAAVDTAADKVREALGNEGVTAAATPDEPAAAAPADDVEAAIARGQANMRARADEAMKAVSATKPLSTGAKVAIGLGTVGVVAGVGYFAARRFGWQLPFMGAASAIAEATGQVAEAAAS